MSNVIHGARAKFLLNGQVIAWANDVTVTETIEQEELAVLDRYEPMENVDTAYRVQMRARFFRLLNGGLRSLGFWPLTGRTPEELRSAILARPELIAEIHDATGTMLKRVSRVKPRSWTVNFAARQVTANDVEFTAIYATDEGESA